MKALIDGDGIAYRAAASIEKTKYLVESTTDGLNTVLKYPEFHKLDAWKSAREMQDALKGNIWSRREIGTLDEAKAVCDSFMRRIRENSSDEYSLFLTPGSGNFRDNLATHTKYKANRDGALRPVYLADIREYLCDSYSGRVVKGHEAEDEVSIEACRLRQEGYIVVGNDKDLLQIPGRHYNWVEDQFFLITTQEAKDCLWMQTLMGDRTDNIPGCWRMGFQKAKNRVSCWANASADFMMDIIIKEYEKSKKVKGCPYAQESEEDTYNRVYETYWLVKLKEYPDEAIWQPKIKNKTVTGEVANGKTKAREGTSKSDCVPVASERGDGTISTGTATVATCATGSE